VGGEKDRGKKIRDAESYQAVKHGFLQRGSGKNEKRDCLSCDGRRGSGKKEVLLAMLPLSHAGVAKKRGLT
jgi:hypothetical protein